MNQDGWYTTPPSGNYPPYETWMTLSKVKTYNLDGHSAPWFKLVPESDNLGLYIKSVDYAGNVGPQMTIYLQHLT